MVKSMEEIKKNNFLKKDTLLKKRVKNIGKSRQYVYSRMADILYHITSKTPTQLVEIALIEQDPFKTINGERTFKYAPFRTINQIQDEIYETLEKQNLKHSTIAIYIIAFRSFFKYYDVELAQYELKKPQNNNRLKSSELPSYDDVYYAVTHSNTPLQQLLYLFPAKTGLRISDIRSLKFQDVIEGAKLYCNNIDELLKIDPFEKDMFIRLELIPQKTKNRGNLCITFMDPELITYFQNYVIWRKKEINKTKKSIEKLEKLTSPSSQKKLKTKKKKLESLEITPSAYIFCGIRTEKRLGKSTAGAFFREMNQKIMETYNSKGKDFKKIDYTECYSTFRAHNLRKLFSTTCRQNIGKIQRGHGDTYADLDIISLFTGHIPPNGMNSIAYDAVEDESENSYLREMFMKLSQYMIVDPERRQKVELKKENEILSEKYSETENKIKVLEYNEIQRKRELDEGIKRIKEENREMKENIKNEAAKAVEEALSKYQNNI